MAIVEKFDFTPLDSIDDPDDYRPNSKLALVVDPGDKDSGIVQNMSVFREQLGVGDEIPLHQHTIDEVLMVINGRIKVRLGSMSKEVYKDAVIFIPSKVPHSFKNIGNEVAEIVATFPSSTVDINYLERNPAPGTKGQDPGPPVAIDIREFNKGNFEEAVKTVDANSYLK
ncbi:cupin domain-containing protein [Algoriphagus chordae]|uniref:Mannose-6-phosphate isomerase-like protein (Cupin superfamily) n=1 Tax=Algoriphagus chordae TaxID=237019 RepID=A0A2W7SD47_9BACT|nr:cupin domain-containing protein [Algoriphagus chordae]PZX48552.1 mannose-6-phosphate isomerase-like protein (cupin superfamily) [Algoriphagus chordae]